MLKKVLNKINKINDLKDVFKNCNPLKLIYKSSTNENEINKYIENIKKYGGIEEAEKKIFDSKIEFDENLVKSWLDNRQFIAELLFRKSTDGSKFSDFFNKCEKKGIIIIFIETTSWYKFGGYSQEGWGDFGLKNDESNFIFSFNYNNKSKDKISFDYNSYYGPNFKSHYYNEIYFSGSLDKGLTGTIQNINELAGDLILPLTKNQILQGVSKSIIFNDTIRYYDKREWNVKELEVYKITYI